MSRSGYTYDIVDTWQMIRWRGAVASATRGRRGQTFLKDLLNASDSMADKKLIEEDLVRDGEYCAIGVLGSVRKLDMSNIDPEDTHQVAKVFGVANALVRETVWENDRTDMYDFSQKFYVETPEHRWQRMRDWVAEQILPIIN